MMAEHVMLKLQAQRLERHTSESDGELTDDAVLRTARLSGTRKRTALRMQRASTRKKRRLEIEGIDGGYPASLRMEATLDTNDKQKASHEYRLANYFNICVGNNPNIELRPLQEYELHQIQPGWFVVNHNLMYNETYVRYHASKKHGKKDFRCVIQNQTLAVILAVDDTNAKARPYGEEPCAVMNIRTIGEDQPIDGFVSINYFYVLTYNREPLFAPQTADDAFWRNVVVNLAEHGSHFGRYYHQQLQGYVHLPYPQAPPEQPVAQTGSDREWQEPRGWQWSWNEGYGASSSSSSSWWQTDERGWQDRGWSNSGRWY